MTAASIDDLDLELIVELHEVSRADGPQEPEGLVVAAEYRVLPVVDDFAGFGIGERGGATTQRRPRFQDQHARTAPGKIHRRAQPGEAGTDNDDVRRRHAIPRATGPRSSPQSPPGAGVARGWSR